MPQKLFLSYARPERSRVAALVTDLQRAGFEPFFDEQLTGGQRWWEQLLAQIETCDAFLPILSRTYVNSVPCRREADYAHALGKPVLPIMLEQINPAECADYIAEAQCVSYDADDRNAGFDLVRALIGLPSSAPLAHPLPARPEIPVTYAAAAIRSAKDRIESINDLSRAEQVLLLSDIKMLFAESHEATARELLLAFQQRGDLTVHVANEIAVLLAAPGPPAPAGPRELVTAAAPELATAPEDSAAIPLAGVDQSDAPPGPEAVLRTGRGAASSSKRGRTPIFAGAAAVVILLAGGVAFALDGHGSGSSNALKAVAPPTSKTPQAAGDALTIRCANGEVIPSNQTCAPPVVTTVYGAPPPATIPLATAKSLLAAFFAKNLWTVTTLSCQALPLNSDAKPGESAYSRCIVEPSAPSVSFWYAHDVRGEESSFATHPGDTTGTWSLYRQNQVAPFAGGAWATEKVGDGASYEFTFPSHIRGSSYVAEGPSLAKALLSQLLDEFRAGQGSGTRLVISQPYTVTG